MRIIAGKYKGRKLEEPKDYSIRPTSDMAREALASILQTRIPGSIVLDLFAGTGAVGLEMLSRGAAKVVFCDQSPQSIDLVNRNLTKVGEKPNILRGSWQGCLASLGNKQFDIIFLDPPYAMDVAPVMEQIHALSLCRPDGIVVYEHDSSSMPPAMPCWQQTSLRRYGRVAFGFYQNTQE